MRRKKPAPRSARRDAGPIAVPRGHRASRAVVVIVAIIGIGVVAMLGRWRVGRSTTSPQQSKTVAAFVGSRACASCHAEQAADWSRSQHRAAMATANDTTVLGDFNDARFTYAGTTTRVLPARRQVLRPHRRTGRQARRLRGEVHVRRRSRFSSISSSLPDGRLQALSIAWDSRPKSQNGQRWFHLYPNERVTHDDELHWTQPSQNWNFMCADCHSTGAAQELRSRHRSISDAAGPRSASAAKRVTDRARATSRGHRRNARPRSAASPIRRKGLIAQLDERRGVTWSVSATTGNATRSQPRTSDREIETCAQCHSRRSADRRRIRSRASHSSTTIAPRCSAGRCTTPTASSATRSTTGARSCRAGCTRTA